MWKEKFLPMTRKTNDPVFLGILLILLFSLSGISCARLNPLKKEPASSPVSNADLQADSALGALPKGGLEAGKAVQEIEAEATADEMLGELSRKEKEEEEQRLRRIVAEDRVLEEQIRRQ